MRFQVGQKVGDYEFLAVVESTPTGVTYRVQNALAERQELLKVLPPDLQDDQERVDRFLREAKIHARLHHPNIAAFYNATRVDGQLVMTSELVEGASLEQRLASGSLPVEQAAKYFQQALSALSYAHREGVVHRDLKPAHLIITPDDNVKITGFALAKKPTDPQLTQPGIVIGSMHYMSPEQVKGSTEVDRRSDIYSLGVVLYEAVTGKKPFDSKSQFEVFLAHVNQDPQPPSSVRAEIPGELDQIILTAMAKQPDSRFQTAEEFRDSLGKLQTVLGDPAAPLSAPLSRVEHSETTVAPRSSRPGRSSWEEPRPATRATPTAAAPPAAAPPETAERTPQAVREPSLESHGPAEPPSVSQQRPASPLAHVQPEGPDSAQAAGPSKEAPGAVAPGEQGAAGGELSTEPLVQSTRDAWDESASESPGSAGETNSGAGGPSYPVSKQEPSAGEPVQTAAEVSEGDETVDVRGEWAGATPEQPHTPTWRQNTAGGEGSVSEPDAEVPEAASPWASGYASPGASWNEPNEPAAGSASADFPGDWRYDDPVPAAPPRAAKSEWDEARPESAGDAGDSWPEHEPGEALRDVPLLLRPTGDTGAYPSLPAQARGREHNSSLESWFGEQAFAGWTSKDLLAVGALTFVIVAAVFFALLTFLNRS